MAGTKESVLIVFWEDEENIPGYQAFREKLPSGWELDFARVEFKPDAGNTVPLEKWNKATIIVSHFLAMPPSREAVPNLKWIQLLSAGVNHILDHPIIKDTNIKVTTVSGIHGPPIAEWVTMATLVLSRTYSLYYENQKAHKWVMPFHLLKTARDWAGKKVGIAGYGSIGRQVGNVFRAMGSEIHAFTASPRTTPESRVDRGYIVPGTGDPDGSVPTAWHSGLSKADLHSFLRVGLDLVVVCLPLTPQTRHIFGAEEFAIMGADCTVVNIARGELIDQDALLKALNDETIKGAALDVTTPEPLPEDHPLWTAKNCVISPHSSAVGIEYIPRSFDVVNKNIELWLQGKPLMNLVSREKGY